MSRKRPLLAAEALVPIDSEVTALAARSAEETPRLQLTSRTHCDRIVVFEGNLRQNGQIPPPTIYDADAFALFGAVVTHHVGLEVYQLA